MNTRVKAIPMGTLASTALTSGYKAINASGLPEACFYLRVNNAGTTTITISMDGINDFAEIITLRDWESQSQTNAVLNQGNGLWPKGTVIYAKGTAGASGNITVSGLYY